MPIFIINTRLLHDKTVRNDTLELSLRGTIVTKQSRLLWFLNNHLNKLSCFGGYIKNTVVSNAVLLFFK